MVAKLITRRWLSYRITGPLALRAHGINIFMIPSGLGVGISAFDCAKFGKHEIKHRNNISWWAALIFAIRNTMLSETLDLRNDFAARANYGKDQSLLHIRYCILVITLLLLHIN